MAPAPSSSSTTTATIPNVVATHLVGDRTLQIARGQLTLQPTLHSLAKASAAAAAPAPAHKDRSTLPSNHGETNGSIDPNIPILLLTVGNATWLLYQSTLFGTHDKDETLYTFLAEMAPPQDSEDVAAAQPTSDAVMQPSSTAAPATETAATPALPATKASLTSTWIRLTLPAAVCAYKSPVQLGRDRMETLLIKHGLLKDGFAAAADEIAKSAQQSGQQTADSIRQRTEGYLASTPATSMPASFSDRTHRIASSAAAGTATAASYTHTASEAISYMAHTAGAAMGKVFAWTRRPSHDQGGGDGATHEETPRLDRRPSTGRRISLERFGFGRNRSKSPNPPPAAAQPGQTHQPATLHGPSGGGGENPNAQLSTIQSVGEAAGGVWAGTSVAASTGLESAHRIIANDHGPQAASVAGDTGNAVKNSAQVAWDATLVTSTVAHGAAAGKGAYDETNMPSQ